MTTTTTERPKSPSILARIAAGERFASTTAEHKMTVLHDDGAYKHLLFKKPGDSFYWYELIVWPGCLTISGDMGTWTFRRDTDMLRFFRANPDRALGSDYRINDDYWAEKLQGGLDSGRQLAREYDEKMFAAHLLDLVRERAEDAGLDDVARDTVLAHVRADLTDAFGEHGKHSEAEDLESARGYQHSEEFIHRDDDPDDTPETFVVTFDWDDVYDAGPFHSYDPRFLWCLHAIVSGIAQYDAHVANTPAAPASPTPEQVFQAWYGTTEPWGGCADKTNVMRVHNLLTAGQ